jgi:uncharacterized protein YndB with AHSA1/START domain
MPASPQDSALPQPPPLVVSRRFAAARELVFSAWSSAEHLRHWFCPSGFSVPEAEVEFRVGGAFNICMRSPEGHDHWTHGRYAEIVPPSRLVIDMDVGAKHEPPLFRARTVVTLAEDGGGTRLEVTQHYTILQAAALAMVAGAAPGWSQTLDRLQRELEQQRARPLERSAVQGTFHIERRYDASPAQVFTALTDPTAKARWFSGGSGFTALARRLDVRPGGREHLQGRWASGTVTTFDAVYLDVVPDARLIYAYEMHLDARKISVSLATLELKADGTGTRLRLTEQGSFLDGYEDAGSRERGTGSLLDALGSSLQQDRSAR